MLRKLFLLFALILATPLSAQSSPIVIDASRAPYASMPQLEGIDVNSMIELRIAAMFAATGAYRTLHGPLSLPAGSRFTIRYADGTVEVGVVTSVASTMGTVPVPGTQRNSEGQLISPPSSGGGGGGFIGGGRIIGGGTVTVGDPKPDPKPKSDDK